MNFLLKYNRHEVYKLFVYSLMDFHKHPYVSSTQIKKLGVSSTPEPSVLSPETGLRLHTTGEGWVTASFLKLHICPGEF